MNSLSRTAENDYCEHGRYKFVIGVDEAGRGPLAGPVVAVACYIPSHVAIAGVIDSKQTKEADREATYELLTNHAEVVWGVSIISHTIIDEINILQASLKAMNIATESLLEKFISTPYHIDRNDCIALIDGNKLPKDMSIASKFVIKGDSLIFSIAAASIIAKVTRDRIMVELSKTYPEFNLDKHKGYPTLGHRTTLMRLGPTPIHRLSYAPVKLAAEKHNMIVPASLSQGKLSKESMANTKTGKVTTSKDKVSESMKKRSIEQVDKNSAMEDVEKSVGSVVDETGIRRSSRLKRTDM